MRTIEITPEMEQGAQVALALVAQGWGKKQIEGWFSERVQESLEAQRVEV